ncbi:MAG: FprA family A-type flavoprotein [Candidatus Azobacteroides pseudotrichonymphae]|jgi:flavorubredoxin|uniref:Anaerobic nitric oxide reductase n=1 Tax=Azobacteroides pseudotrichonymphae genomovar. CFP2 TaxID=511995 RepID=B6YQQ3_AZOPC|nr:FprA family A-type flavoprotein [Candidatus Azobacteroides pseudotrichonymphae]BAG83525.1 putative anaerobic nitric oxide reductase [Candidatus Azobacteroides pseudotrichonymphae genomovar. CFP2]GMO32776.1 MAG: FprA family A-type flavoprotein [Candidatus Azobacteroides pseudotrichonymphae]
MDIKTLKISDSVQWIGVLDKNIRTFDIIMETKYGTTYNSYFINAQKKAIVETVKITSWETYETKMRQVCNPLEIEYIIINHTEPDHVGNLQKTLQICSNAKVVGSQVTIKFLQNQMGYNFPQLAVKDNDVIDLGNRHLTIISTPNLHWPDSTYTYLQEEQILFTCDSFGAHFCHEEMYDDLVGYYNDAFQYYFDVILKPFSSYFLRAIDKIRSLPIKTICTGHGPILRTYWRQIVKKTEQLCLEYLSNYPVKNRVLIAFVSAYGFTKTIAEKIKEGLEEVKEIEIDFCNIEKMDTVTLSDKVAKASAYLLGSPTINHNMLPQLYQLFTCMNPIREKNKPASCFGSYGWSGETNHILISNINNMKMKFFGETFFIKFKPQENDFEKIKNFGKKFGLFVRS